MSTFEKLSLVGGALALTLTLLGLLAAYARSNAKKREDIEKSVVELRKQLAPRLSEVEKQVGKEDWHGDAIDELRKSVANVRSEAGVDRVKIAKVEAKQNGVK